MLAFNNIKSLCSQVRQNLSQRADTEHEQAFVRLVIGILLFLYFSYLSFSDTSHRESWNIDFIQFMVGFIVASLIFIIHIIWSPAISPIRRLVASAVDAGTITYFFFNAAASATPLYFLYLWIIFGYGFRYGKQYLFFTLFLSLTGFGAAIFMVPYWHDKFALGAGLWSGMLLVSLYVSTLVGRLTSALDHAELANQAKRRFISSVSHELRTPLNAIIGMTDLLHSTVLTMEQKDMVRSLDNASRTMLSLIEDVLDFSKIEAGKLVLEKTDFDLYQLVHSTTDIFKYQAAEHNLRLSVFVDPAVPFALRGDPNHLRQVLVNLVSNSIKFTQKGGITLRVLCAKVHTDAVRLRFEVQDTGIGIKEEFQNRIFESFTQEDESVSRRYGGTGLGTTISKQLVELMGGKIGLQSKVGVGSLFWFELDIEKQCENFQADTASIQAVLIGFDRDSATFFTDVLSSLGIRNCKINDVTEASKWLGSKTDSDLMDTLVLLHQPETAALNLSAEAVAKSLKQSIGTLRNASSKNIFIAIHRPSNKFSSIDQSVIEEDFFSSSLTSIYDESALFNVVHAFIIQKTSINDASSNESEESFPRHPQARYRILVAEDNATNSKVIEKILERAGHQCVLVGNGEEALDKLAEEDFDVVIFDMNMPVMNGIEAAKTYRFMCPNDMRAPIIMFSANVTKEAKEESMSAGIDAFLSKPVQVKELLATLDKIVENFGGVQKKRTSFKATPLAPIVIQQRVEGVVLNFATLAELESISQNPLFIEELLDGFVADNKLLMQRLENALLSSRLEKVKEILHALKGSAISIGAVALRETCHRLEKLNHADLKQDKEKILSGIKQDFTLLLDAINYYRKQRCQQLYEAK